MVNRFESSSEKYLSLKEAGWGQFDKTKFSASFWITVGLDLPKWKLWLIRILIGKTNFAQFQKLCRMHVKDIKGVVMKVSELMDKLRAMPQDKMVVVRGYEDGVDEVTTVNCVEVAVDYHDAWYYGAHQVVDEEDKKSSDYHGKEIVPAVELKA